MICAFTFLSRLLIMNSIPPDLSYEIFSRLSTKTIARCRCVSKLWRSILRSADFTELFLTKSSARPSLLFALKRATNEFHFYSSPQIHIQNEKSSLAAYCKLKIPDDMQLIFYSHASGLFCFRYEPISKKDEHIAHVICNPSTGETVFLPKRRTGHKSFLGFDPIDKVFKVVSPIAGRSPYGCIHNILTLGTGEMRWRKIQCSLSHCPDSSGGICINGALYYLATGRDAASYVVCFDVRSENFKFIQADFKLYKARSLINYKGKLGVIIWTGHNSGYLGGEIGLNRTHELHIWVLEDVVKHDWSEYAYTLPDDKFGYTGRRLSYVSVAGVTATGEIVLYCDFAIFYFHPERNTIQRVPIQGFENHDRVYAFVNHVDDLTLNIKPHRVQQDLLTFDMNYHQLQQHVPRFEKINKFAALSLLEDE
ncbi:hypothetical protein BRARA_I02448 [Brassica rapa]|uniref:F-box domain-containing protein n=1 Tax=Brassica campestris TaxID=3711 RepID=A0A397Y565_BRACM|nr:hypothetical protein BRARA_I02448 [Brassica rapa]